MDYQELIIKIEDETNSHKLELKGIKNIDGKINICIVQPKEIAINSKKFQKLVKDQESRQNNQIKINDDQIELDILK